jgi:hypothetical protein
LTLSQAELYGADIGLVFDSTVVSSTAVTKGELAVEWSMASNLGLAGKVRVAMAGATPITSSDGLLQFGFHVLGSPCSETSLTLARGDLNEGLIPTEAAHGSIAICHQADCDCSGLVDVVDIQMVAGRWRCGSSDGCYQLRYDMDGDGVITVVDIMLVAAEWGWSCP